MVGTIVIDGLFAAIAAIGFGAISNPPRRAFLSIAIAAAIGHALRFSLMHYVGVDIITASFCASFVIGWVSLFLGSLIYCPMTVVYIPALLPMIPGMYAYKTVFALLLFRVIFPIPIWCSVICRNFLSTESLLAELFSCWR